MNQHIYAGGLLMAIGLILGGCGGPDGLGIQQWNFIGNKGAQLVQRIDLSPAARRDHLGQYQKDPNWKAFAVSPNGAHGVAFNYSSASEAQDSALNQCRRDLRPGDLDCTIYDINGSIVLTTPVSLSPYQAN